MSDSDGPKFDADERVTANLRLRSISPRGRFLLGAFAFIPHKWRGPIALGILALIGYLAIMLGPALFRWIVTYGAGTP